MLRAAALSSFSAVSTQLTGPFCRQADPFMLDSLRYTYAETLAKRKKSEKEG